MTLLQHLADAYVRAHEVVLDWHMAHPGQSMPHQVEAYAVLMAALHDHATRIHGAPVDLPSLARETT